MINFNETPKSGRREPLMRTLKLLHECKSAPSIVEVGTVRNATPRAMETDGWATRIFAWYRSQEGGTLTAIDPNPEAQNRINEICTPWASGVRLINESALDVIGDVGHIDLLYMDGPAEARFHMDLYLALKTQPKFVLFDDIIDEEYNLKGALAIPHMLADGYWLRFRENHQALLERVT